MKKFIALLAAVLIVLPLLAFGASANDTASSAKFDYAGLISRIEKVEKYPYEWSYKVFMPTYGYSASIISIARFLDADLRDKYFSYESGSAYAVWKSTEEKEKFDAYFIPEVQKSGLPSSYYFIKYSGMTREQARKCISQFQSSSGRYYDDRLADGFFAQDTRTVIETYMSPDAVINMDKYNSDDPKYKFIQSEEYGDMWLYSDFISYSDEILETPLEKLDKWNYSDEYWYDYYSFLKYVSDRCNSEGDSFWELGAYISAGAVRSHEAEFNRRLAIYAERVGKSPSTGDTSGTRAVIFTSAAALAAIPAAILTFRRKREDAEAV